MTTFNCFIALVANCVLCNVCLDTNVETEFSELVFYILFDSNCRCVLILSYLSNMYFLVLFSVCYIWVWYNSNGRFVLVLILEQTLVDSPV